MRKANVRERPSRTGENDEGSEYSGEQPSAREGEPDDRLVCQKSGKGGIIPRGAERTRPTCFISVV